MAVIPYNDLLQAASVDDLAMLTAFAFGQRIHAADDVEADALFAEAVRLNTAGLLTELHRVYVVQPDGTVKQAFDGFVVNEAKAYINALSRERLALSRDPIPPVTP